ncbi:DUF1833 family protein [Ruegeria atlantica]|uniref:DUF1833 family protein n=1 Tax=Ruegeria atlantica TaxID=81569 RepID=UPI00147E5C81|nr:DUF1833 family protein [Ruegeria atlantica]
MSRPASRATKRARTALTPEDTQLAALEISHPDISRRVRIINDAPKRDRRIGRYKYKALGFNARIADDRPGRRPAAELSIDNVGREIIQWIDQAQATRTGIHGISVRVMAVTARGLAPVVAPDYDVSMGVLSITAKSRHVTAVLGFDPQIGRPAVMMRHDPATSPGLF